MGKNLITWNEGYSVDIPELDNQHKILISILNRLYNSYLNKSHDKDIVPLLDELKDYTKYHFESEERLFREKNYPMAQEHIKAHESFKEELLTIIESYNDLSLVLTMKTMTLLQRWLTNHILKEDKKYVGYI